ncbi:hypothetical protein BgiBS90_036552 [Biomphalaria glabrata]|nr:hypothetical protein BgiBS90_036552 [Biomphalaria glabrata]
MANKLIISFAILFTCCASSDAFLINLAPFLSQLQQFKNSLNQTLAGLQNATANNTTRTTCNNLFNLVQQFGNGTIPPVPTNFANLLSLVQQGAANLTSAANGTIAGNLRFNLFNFANLLRRIPFLPIGK